MDNPVSPSASSWPESGSDLGNPSPYPHDVRLPSHRSGLGWFADHAGPAEKSGIVDDIRIVSDGLGAAEAELPMLQMALDNCLNHFVRQASSQLPHGHPTATVG